MTRIAVVAMLAGSIVHTTAPSTAQTELPAACPDAEASASPFPDVTVGNVHASAIVCLVSEPHGVVSGRADGTYGPALGVTRAQMAGFLVRVLDAVDFALPEEPADAFSDDRGSVFARAIDQLAALDVVRGVGDGRYRPDATVDRAQMATYLVAVQQLVTVGHVADHADAFGDDDGSVHEPNIDRAAGLDLVHGTTAATYAPGAPVRRDQMASFLARLLDQLLVEDILDGIEETSDGHVFVAGRYVSPPYRLETRGFQVLVNGVPARPVRTEEPPAFEPPADPRTAAELVAVAAARYEEIGWNSHEPPSEAVIEELVSLLESYPATSSIDRPEPWELAVTDTEDETEYLRMLPPMTTSPRLRELALERQTRRWREVLDAGGALLTAGGETVAVPTQLAPDLLASVGAVFDLPEEERVPAMTELLGAGALAEAIVATGDPRPAMGDRMPEPQATGVAPATTVTAASNDHLPPHRYSRTPGTNRAYLFTPASAENNFPCNTDPLYLAAWGLGYTIHHFDGVASSMGALASSSGKAGILYACMHGGGAYEVHFSEAERDRAYDSYHATGLANGGLKKGYKSWTVLGAQADRYYIGPTIEWLHANWQPANTLVLLEACGDFNMGGAYRARDFIAPDELCYPDDNEEALEQFWGRLDGSIDDGARRNVIDAFEASMQQTVFELLSQDRGRTVLVPAVRNHLPRTPVPVGDDVSGGVLFDARMYTGGSRRIVRLSGTCDAELVSGSFTDAYNYEFTFRARRSGELTFTVDGWQAVSGDATSLHLDGNTFPEGTDHVAPNWDHFIWTVPCVVSEPDPSPTPTDVPTDELTEEPTEEPGTPTPTDEPDDPDEPTPTTTDTTSPSEPPPTTSPSPSSPSPTSPSPSDTTHTLTVVTRSLQTGTLTTDAVTANPDRAAYGDGENVTLTALTQFDENGYRHFFLGWEVSPSSTPHAASDNVLSLSMDSDVEVTAVYESQPL